MAGTSILAITATTEGTAQTLIAGTSQAFDTAPVYIELYFPGQLTAASSGSLSVVCFRGATNLGHINMPLANVAGNSTTIIWGQWYDPTPAGGTYSYTTKAWISGGSATTINVQAGAGGAATLSSGYQRVSSAAVTA